MNEMSTNVPTIADAIALAAEHHRDTDKGGAPYILHPIRVMLAMTTDEARTVAVLHDLLEDTKVTAEDLRKRGYREPEIEALQALTRKKDKDETYDTFIERVERIAWPRSSNEPTSWTTWTFADSPTLAHRKPRGWRSTCVRGSAFDNRSRKRRDR